MPWETSRHRGSTRTSRRDRAVVLTRDPTCYLRYDGCTHAAVESDHVIPLHQGGTDTLDNQRGACHHCHGIKTRREAAAAKPRRRRPAEAPPGLTQGG